MAGFRGLPRPRRVAVLAAVAVGVMAATIAANVMGDLATVRRKRDVLREHCAAVGRDEVELTHLSTTLIGADDRQVRAFYPKNADAWATGERTADCWVTATKGGLPPVEATE